MAHLGTLVLILALLAAIALAIAIVKLKLEKRTRSTQREPKLSFTKWLAKCAVAVASLAAFPLAFVLAMYWHGDFAYHQNPWYSGIFDSHAEARRAFLGMIGMALLAGVALAHKFGFLDRD